MASHLFGKFIIEVSLSDGTRAYLMEEDDGYIMCTKNPDAAARFMTEAGAKKYYYSVYHMPTYCNTTCYITNGWVKKSNHI